jgi:hemerythrin-like domain-containing protein
MNETTNLFALIKADHKQLKSLFAQLEETTERALKTRDRLYAKLREEISLHSRAEENAVYPRLKDKDLTQDMAYESVEEHGVVRWLLSRLDAVASDSKEWTALICVLQESIEHHMKEEEGALFPKMRKLFSSGELQEMAEHFTRSKLGVFERIRESVAA